MAQVKSYSHKAGRNLDWQRRVSQIGQKKAEPTTISQTHAQLLKQEPGETLIGGVIAPHVFASRSWVALWRSCVTPDE